MYTVVILSVVLSCASAFTTRASMRMAADGAAPDAMSASIPFLKAPKNLAGYAVYTPVKFVYMFILDLLLYS
jgi:hypothetical protein